MVLIIHFCGGFNKFFQEASSAKDYIEICNKYDWILINEFSLCNDDNADRVRRFISFIDVAYKENTKVKFFDEELIQKIYTLVINFSISGRDLKVELMK